MPRASLPADGSVRPKVAIFSPFACGTRYRCFCVLGAPRQQRQAVQPDVHRQDHAQRRVDVLELLARDAEADVVHAGAAVFGRHADAEQAEVGHLRQDARSKRCSRSSSWMRGATSRRGPLAYRLLEQAVLLGQIEVDHGVRQPIRLAGHVDRRTDAWTPSGRAPAPSAPRSRGTPALPKSAATSPSPISA